MPRLHAERPQAAEFSVADMKTWWAPRDLLGVTGERVITRDCRWRKPSSWSRASWMLSRPPRACSAEVGSGAGYEL
ncbi:hypothetical protein GCM10009559_60740 [Pseudonocardia zijingensis]|uniref:Uncharacterized protein n=1 Tax=Pseudonocardia zijingensis TaxID=153376 RepID=A0ABP3YLT0_9PSEU